MPIYAYECTECGYTYDRLQRLSDPDPIDCPACSKAALRRQLTAPSFRLAGSGWYETDFKKEGDKKRNLADSGDKGESGKSESKPDSKPEPATAKVAESKPAAVSKPATTTD